MRSYRLFSASALNLSNTSFSDLAVLLLGKLKRLCRRQSCSGRCEGG